MTTATETSGLALILQSYADQDDFPEAYNIKMVKDYLSLAATYVERLEAVRRAAEASRDDLAKYLIRLDSAVQATTVTAETKLSGEDRAFLKALCATCLHPLQDHKGDTGGEPGGSCGSSSPTEKERFGGMDWCTCKEFVPHTVPHSSTNGGVHE